MQLPGFLRRSETREQLPEAVRRQLPSGSRVLAASPVGRAAESGARTGDQGWVVATPTALYRWVTGHGPAAGALQRHAWHEIDVAVWDDEQRVVTVRWVQDREPWALPLADEGTFIPEVLRERIESSVVSNRRVGVQGIHGFRVVVRRDDAGGLLTQVLPDPGVDLSAPDVAAKVAHAVGEARQQVGL